jgi:hypothetical protein
MQTLSIGTAFMWGRIGAWEHKLAGVKSRWCIKSMDFSTLGSRDDPDGKNGLRTSCSKSLTSKARGFGVSVHDSPADLLDGRVAMSRGLC